MSEMINPYIAGAPVTEAGMFFGREDIFDWVERSLPGRYVDHILVIHGQRRVGKTSVLKQLPNRLPERYIPVFFDLQGRTHTTLERFLWWLAREITRVLKQDHGVVIPMPKVEAFAEDPEHLESQFLPSLQPQLGDRNLLLTFDEFDSLEEADVKEVLARPLIEYLKRLTRQEGLNFIFSIGSTGHKLENMQASYTEFFKAALYKEISFLGREDTFDLIRQPVQGLIEYDSKAVNRIYQIASGHPYFSQLVCHELFSRCQKTGGRRIGEQDVEAVLDDVVERGTVNLKFVWDEASDLEKWVLACLAHMKVKADTRALTKSLKEQRVRFSQPDLETALLHMREKDVLTQDNRFVIQLMGIWVQKNRPLERVREELIEVNPIASRYIEIGQEYKDIGQFDKAIDSFHEALRVDPENKQAQVSIAAVYLHQKAYDQAVSEYEKALTIDGEDVAARAGLCEAHLALGDQALAKGKVKDAIRSYQQVLSINAEHTDARQRMADIHRQNAEQAVADGRFGEAFDAFKEALQFTPEDEVLESRFAEVREQHQTKIIAGLIAKAERERSAKRWDLAIGLLEEALELAPEDASLQEQLTDIRQVQRQNQLKSLREQANTQIKAERWDEALASWGAYLALDPEDRETVLAEMERLEQGKRMGQSYAEARQAMSEKDYDRAVRLLKELVFEDETYKDASRLMAEAIESRRAARPFWKNKWLWGGIGGVAIVMVVLVSLRYAPFGLQLPSKATPQPLPMPTASPKPIIDPTPQPVPMGIPTSGPLPTPIPLSWTRLNSGQTFSRDTVTTIVIDPNDPEVLYVGTENAGIYKSIDGGASWQPKHNGLGRAWIHSLVIDLQDTRILYTGVSSGGVYKTTDGGESWRAVNTGINDFGWEHAAELAIDPQDNQHLLYTAHSNGIYATHDGGETWSLVSVNYPGNCLVALRFHPVDSQTLFAIDHAERDWGCPGGVHKSEDGGHTWEMVGLEGREVDETSSQLLVVDHQSGDLLYASTDEGLYGSRDGGGSWHLLTQQHCSGLGIAADNGEIVYCAARDQNQLLATANGGDTWVRHDLGQYAVEISSDNIPIAVSPHDADTLVIGGGGVYVSKDAGGSWTERNSGLGAAHLELRNTPADWHKPSSSAGLFLLEGNGQLLHQSIDDGRTWSLLSDSGQHLAFDAAGEILYRLGGDMWLRSQDGGQYWERLSVPLEEASSGIAAHPVVSQSVYVIYGCEQPPHLWFSEDGGDNWEQAIGTEPISHGRLYFDHDQGQVVYGLGVDNAIRSEDAGKTWKRCTNTEEWHSRSGSRVIVDPRNSDRLILATRGGGILISEDGCQSWHVNNNGLGNLFVNTVAANPENPDTIYAGTDSGAYVSFDGGERWGEISDGLLGAMVVYSIVVDAEDPTNVFAATPYGIFKLEGQ